MKYSFDEIINRTNTNSIKYDYLSEIFGNKNLLPLWVADMDFKVCPKITERFTQIINHGIFGYHIISKKYYESIINWQKTRHNYNIDRENIFFSSGVVPAVKNFINTFTNKDDGILIQSPIYYPFFSVIKQTNRKLLINRLIEKENIYSIDFDDFEKKASEAKIFILCNPHNPVSRVWQEDELKKMAEICLKYNVIIISDEIHSDIVFEHFKHIPIATLNEDIKKITITCSSASKTFNLAALNTAYTIINNKEYILKYKRFVQNFLTENPNLFGLEAMLVAYNDCADWLNDMLEYIYGNYQFLINFLSREMPFIKYSPLEGTYLVWLDFRELKLNDIELKQHIIERAGLALNDGPIFGPGGSGFQRINIACPRDVLSKALEMLKQSFKKN